MSNKQNDQLIDAVRDIGYAADPEYALHPERTPEPKVTAGPNNWNEVKDDPTAYGPENDFELLDHYRYWVFFPISRAAIEWCRAHLPEHLDRWGSHGYKIPATAIREVVTAAQCGGLMSEDDYKNAQEELCKQQAQAMLEEDSG